MTQVETKVFTAHLPISLADKVDMLAEKLERSRGWVMKQALTDWIAQEEEQERLTREALADVDTGDFIDDHIVQIWANSLATENEHSLPCK